MLKIVFRRVSYAGNDGVGVAGNTHRDSRTREENHGQDGNSFHGRAVKSGGFSDSFRVQGNVLHGPTVYQLPFCNTSGGLCELLGLLAIFSLHHVIKLTVTIVSKSLAGSIQIGAQPLTTCN